jgi:hypothetical protein
VGSSRLVGSTVLATETFPGRFSARLSKQLLAKKRAPEKSSDSCEHLQVSHVVTWRADDCEEDSRGLPVDRFECNSRRVEEHGSYLLGGSRERAMRNGNAVADSGGLHRLAITE